MLKLINSSFRLAGFEFRIACALCLSLVTSVFAPAQTFTNLVSFNTHNGDFPEFVIQGPDGNVWGTTVGFNPPDCGTIYKMTPIGRLKVVYAFDCTSGKEPSGLTLGTDGNFYGTTFEGGSGSGGTVFKLTPSGTLTFLYNFPPDGENGSGPLGSLAEGRDGNFYGATYGGGNSFSYGTLFRITPGGTLTTLYTFDFTSGAQPYAGMILGTDGNFYGTTYSGGKSGQGTVYKLTSTGVYTELYGFGQTSNDGFSPVVTLVQGRDGNLYGTTPNGGTDNVGTVFKITPTGTYTSLHSFTEIDGRFPGQLIQGTDGNFYSATAYGGTNDVDGTLFKMTLSGVVTTLFNFNGVNGALPIYVMQHTNGTFFGTTGAGGEASCSCGTAYQFSVGLGPFIESIPTFGRVGSPVTILGTGLSGTTSVTFNGTPAQFTVLSATEIRVKVPSGASTGKVRVITPNLTLSSNLVFRVSK